MFAMISSSSLCIRTVTREDHQIIGETLLVGFSLSAWQLWLDVQRSSKSLHYLVQKQSMYSYLWGCVVAMSHGGSRWEVSETKLHILCNKSTISITQNPTMHGRTKHIDTHFHFIHNLVGDGIIDIWYCRTNEHWHLHQVIAKSQAWIFSRSSRCEEVLSKGRMLKHIPKS